ncbi:retrovirus-related pol polyprotein from transposon TNT 1-94 [Tanacetum coccineum]|uniref:Retrovirus-related pol polyprotein from transposon TNT 1-94 n=1 Tax=Tanacetum coccineum TaxID=301880 RepID=A0ABQ4ZEW1_9ASTR
MLDDEANSKVLPIVLCIIHMNVVDKSNTTLHYLATAGLGSQSNAHVLFKHLENILHKFAMAAEEFAFWWTIAHVFTRRHGGDILLVQVYVDDIIFGSTNPDFSKRFANLMKNNFEMSMMGELKFFLGLQVHQSPRGIFISQSQYAIELLKKHGLDECVSMSTPMATERLDADLQGTPTDQTTYRRMIGGLMYLTASRPDIAFATFVCARYQARPTVKHLKEVKRIFRYLRQSYNMGLWYPKDSGFELIAYSDADHAGCKDDCKSTSGGLQFLGGKLVSWSSKKQDCTAMSTAEAEYVSLSACCAQVIWMRTQLLDYGYKYNRIPMYCDSKSAIAISCNPVQHSKTKHIDIRYHFIKEHVEKGTVEIYFVGTEYQLADLFTKVLPKERFEYLVHRIGNFSSKTKISFSQTVETASRLTSDAVTTTPVTGSHQPRRRQTPRLYLMRRSLEVLRKSHWMILGGRFNQLSHVSSPLLSKPGEY